MFYEPMNCCYIPLSVYCPKRELSLKYRELSTWTLWHSGFPGWEKHP